MCKQKRQEIKFFKAEMPHIYALQFLFTFLVFSSLYFFFIFFSLFVTIFLIIYYMFLFD